MKNPERKQVWFLEDFKRMAAQADMDTPWESGKPFELLCPQCSEPVHVGYQPDGYTLDLVCHQCKQLVIRAVLESETAACKEIES